MNGKRLLAISIVLLLVLTWLWRKSGSSGVETKNVQARISTAADSLWAAPDSSQIPSDASGDLIRYGKKLVVATARFFWSEGFPFFRRQWNELPELSPESRDPILGR